VIIDLKRILGIRGRIAKLLYGSEDLRLVGGRIVSCDSGGCISKGYLVVREFTESPEDLGERDVQRILNSYVRVLSENAPLDLRIMVIPTKADEIIRRIDRIIQTKQVMLEADPANEKLRTEIERLRKIKKKIMDGEMPFTINMVFGVIAWGSSEEEAIERLSRRISILREELRGIGIYAEDLRGLGVLPIINEFFRERGRASNGDHI